MKKLFIFVCICIFFLAPVFSFSFQVEYLIVVNYSKQNVIVELEFNTGKAEKERNYFLTQNVGDLILREDGTVALTLDTLPDKIIKKTVTGGYTAYYIEIFDDDFEAKPASQW